MKTLTFSLLLGLAIVLAASSWAAADALPLPKARTLAPKETMTLAFDAAQPTAKAIKIVFADADFGGTTVLAQVNDRKLLPYHAFGGDTRYDNVKGKPGMNPPIAKIEANYVLVADWVKKGANQLTITNAGPGRVIVAEVSVRNVSGHDLPLYENSIYFDFDVWRQGLLMHKGVNWFLDTMLLGIIPGGAAHVMNYIAPPKGSDPNAPPPAGAAPAKPDPNVEEGLSQKLLAEDARVNWGFKRSVFYTIWHLVMSARDWGQFIDVDGKKDTAQPIHTQFANPPEVPKGTDIALIKPDGYLNSLRAGIDGLLPYSSDYIITCEQWGPRGQGFGRWGGDHFAAQGYDAKRWADNYQTEFSKVTGYIHQKNPAGLVYAPQWWIPDIRHLLYDTSLARGFKMRDMTDVMMTHYYSFPFGDFGPDGKLVIDDKKGAKPVSRPELQYPGGKFEAPDFDKARSYMSTWVLIPEIAIDWNRYRLSRTEKEMKFGDPKVNHFANGKPFNFQAGFDGDERAYNNETCVYDRNYIGPSPYQFLYSMFSYSLLPSEAREPKEFKITRTLPLTPEEKPTHDIFSEVEQPINLYGEWVEGAAGTHRLKTKDPLFGDLFGYTGFEQGTTGDYIWLSGIKERHHRREPHNAWNLVRRTCYAFVTAAPVYPAAVNDDDTNKLFVKVLAVKQDGHDVIGVYAVNFHGAPHKLDLTLPAAWSGQVPAQLFNEAASDWSDAKEFSAAPKNGSLRIQATLPAGAPWCVFLYPPAGQIARSFTPLVTPQPFSPWGNVAVAQPGPVLKWRPSTAADGAAKVASYEVQVAKEMLFRAEDLLATQGNIAAAEWKVTTPLVADHRYHWRVRAIDAAGNSTSWSRSQSFWFQPAKERPAAAPAADAPPEEIKPPRAEGSLVLEPFTNADNLAHTGMPFSFPNYWDGAGKAVDGMPESAWHPDGGDEDSRKAAFPAWWAVRFDQEQAVGQVVLLWSDKAAAKDFDVQTWNGHDWQTAQSVRGNALMKNTVQLDASKKTRAVRIHILAPVSGSIGLAEVYMH